MKALIYSLFSFSLILMSLSSPLHAIDQQSLDALKKQGFQVRMGELTGAGSKMSLTRLAGFIHPQGVIMKEEISKIVVAPGSAQNVSDVKLIQVGNESIDAREMEGFFIK